MSNALKRLADHFGISAEYVDIWGKSHSTDDATLRALLRDLVRR